MECIWIKIGDIHFNLRSSVPIIFSEGEPAYRAFIKNSESRISKADVNIRIDLGNLPKTQGFEKIFSSGQSWSMFKYDELYWLVRDPHSYKNPLWIACFNKTISEDVVVYCGEELISEKLGETMVYNPFRYPLDQILVMYFLALNQGAIFHAAGININGKGYIFPGPSGAGKSTISRQFKDQDGIEIFSDDRIVIRKRGESFEAYGTPWPGEEGIALNQRMPLSGIFFLEHGLKNRVKKVRQTEALKKLFKVISIPWYDKEVVSQVLDFCEDVVKGIPFYELQFFPGPEVVSLLEEFSLSS